MTEITIQTIGIPFGLFLLQLLVQFIARDTSYEPGRAPQDELDDELVYGFGDVAGFSLVFLALGLDAAVAFGFTEMQAKSERLSEYGADTTIAVIVLIGAILSIISCAVLAGIYRHEAHRSRQALRQRSRLAVRDSDGAVAIRKTLRSHKAWRRRALMAGLGVTALVPPVLIFVAAIQGPVPKGMN